MDDKAAPAKQRRAIDLVAEHRRAGTGVVSLQVFQEYFVTVTSNCSPSSMLPLPRLPTSWPPSTSTGFTDFLSGMHLSCGPLNRPAVVYCSRKTCKMQGNWMEF